MNSGISVIIPNRNGGKTIGRCLDAVFSSDFEKYEVIVVDDCSTDNSVEIIKKHPCRLIRLHSHSGSSKARNTGARDAQARANGNKILFFTDADCVPEKNALSIAYEVLRKHGPDTVVGGTYTPLPYGGGFFDTFQSVFINYSETKNAGNPDYVASHAMAIYAGTFRRIGGFNEKFLPILEDVELSHRLRQGGCRLVIIPGLLVRHVFNFSFLGSMRNAARKSFYWTIYSMNKKDFLADSGAASVELKTNVVFAYIILLLILTHPFLGSPTPIFASMILFAANIAISKKLLLDFYKAKGAIFLLLAAVYYTTFYAFAAGAGGAAGVISYLFNKNKVLSEI